MNFRNIRLETYRLFKRLYGLWVHVHLRINSTQIVIGLRIIGFYQYRLFGGLYRLF